MSMSINSGPCVDGPWHGTNFVHRTVPVRAGRFNLIGLGGIRGSYTFTPSAEHGWFWRWGPWIEKPEKTQP